MKWDNGKYAVILILFSCVHLGGCRGQGTAQDKEIGKIQPLSYKILYDEMGANISIGVPPEIDEQQLRATLLKAAKDHQDDPARDYLVAHHLWVKAYLVIGERQSTEPAGRLGRYIPPRNPAAKDEDANASREDQFSITLEEAKRSLP